MTPNVLTALQGLVRDVLADVHSDNITFEKSCEWNTLEFDGALSIIAPVRILKVETESSTNNMCDSVLGDHFWLHPRNSDCVNPRTVKTFRHKKYSAMYVDVSMHDLARVGTKTTTKDGIPVFE